jgi:glycosyltransferase involved in cell wall biosynthesis
VSAPPAPLPDPVGLNALFLQPRMGGVETYLKALVPEMLALEPGLRLKLFVNPAGHDVLAAERWAGEVELVRVPLLGQKGLRALGESLALGHVARRHGCQLLHSVAVTAPLRPPLASVLTLHDLTWIVAAEPNERVTVGIWRLLVPPAARAADRLIAVSEDGRRQIVEHLGVAEDRIDVVPQGPGVDPPAAMAEQELRRLLGLGPGPIVLTVSAKRKHKNLDRLIQAFAQIADPAGAQLVLPGNPTRREQDLKRLAADLGVAERVVFPPYVEPEVLEGLYAAADVFAFPSLSEGFGLPVLEAMRRGVPVACARASSLPEVAGDAALLFDPYDVGAIADAIAGLLRDPQARERAAAAGRERARSFTWRATAEGTLAAYRRGFAAASARLAQG